jgi:hypothetical protein
VNVADRFREWKGVTAATAPALHARSTPREDPCDLARARTLLSASSTSTTTALFAEIVASPAPLAAITARLNKALSRASSS